MASPSADVELVYDRYLGADGALDVLERVLRSQTPAWCERLRVYKGARDQVPVAPAAGALKEAALAAAGERGPLYHRLVAEYGAADERLTGSAEFRGASIELTVVVSVDEKPHSRRVSGDILLGNRVALQLRRARVGGRPAAAWAAEVFEVLCAQTAPVWGAIHAGDEYWAKVMADGPGAHAIGRDFGRYLPGIFTANFFGNPYQDLIGRDRLLSAPASQAKSVDSGVLLVLGDDPQAWSTGERSDIEHRVLDHLGPEYFFSKRDPQKATAAPKWPVPN